MKSPYQKIGQALTLITLIVLAHSTHAQSAGTDGQAPPTEHKGLGVTALGVLPESSLKAQIGLSGYKLQLREVSIAPGGQIAMHDHFKKPGLVWTTSGIIQESRPGFSKDYPDTLKEAILEDDKTIHWFRNTTDKMASFVVCDIVPSE